MPQNDTQDLSGVAETLLLPLYIRALESPRPDALIRDEKVGQSHGRLSLSAGRASHLAPAHAAFHDSIDYRE